MDSSLLEDVLALPTSDAVLVVETVAVVLQLETVAVVLQLETAAVVLQLETVAVVLQLETAVETVVATLEAFQPLSLRMVTPSEEETLKFFTF